jgi:biopolymer transport protein ExbD
MMTHDDAHRHRSVNLPLLVCSVALLLLLGLGAASIAAYVALKWLILPPPVLEGRIDFGLPSTGEAKENPNENPEDVALSAEVTVVVKTNKDSGIGALVVKSPLAEKAVPDLAAMEEYLKSIRKSVTNNSDIKIQAESKLKYGSLMETIDACRNAGFDRVGFAPPPDLRND